MSTKSTIYYTDGSNIHIYHELTDWTVWVDKETDGVVVSIRLMTYEEWKKLITSQKEDIWKPMKGGEG